MEARATHFAITREELQPGDIIIVTDTRRHTNSFNQLTRTTQSMQHLLFSQGHNEAVHAQIIVRDDEGQLKIVEVSDDGVLINDIRDDYKYNMFVYRCANNVLAERASQVAYLGYKKYHQNKDEVPHKEITYSDSKLVQAIAFPVLPLPHHHHAKDFSLKTFCSKFVIECFQIAQSQLAAEFPELAKIINKLYIKERTSSVKSLEHSLRKHKDFTSLIIPKGQDRIYPTLIKDLLSAEILRQQKSPKTKDAAFEAMEVYQTLINFVENNNVLANPNYKSFDVSLAILFAVLGKLHNHKVILKQGYEYGFERPMLKDQRIMSLAMELQVHAKQYKENNHAKNAL